MEDEKKILESLEQFKAQFPHVDKIFNSITEANKAGIITEANAVYYSIIKSIIVLTDPKEWDTASKRLVEIRMPQSVQKIFELIFQVVQQMNPGQLDSLAEFETELLMTLILNGLSAINQDIDTVFTILKAIKQDVQKVQTGNVSVH